MSLPKRLAEPPLFKLNDVMTAQRGLSLLGFIFLLVLQISTVQISMAQEAQRYTVKKGDTLYSIARLHGMTVSDIKSLNQLSDNTILIGQELVVSTAGAQAPNPLPTLPDPVFKPASDPVPSRDVTQTGATTTSEQPDPNAGSFKRITRAKRSYVVQPGDTYYSIAVEYGLPAYALFAINGGNTGALEPYETIWIPDTNPIASFDDSDDPLTYTVRKGDTLYGIARKSGTNVRAIMDKNNMSAPSLRIGQVITLPAPTPIPKPKEQNVPPLYEVGPVDIYPDTFAGRITASGDPYDPARFTVSHPELAIETIVLLTNPQTGRSTFAEVNDRGPIDTRYKMDVAAIVARELGLTLGEDQEIQIRVVE